MKRNAIITFGIGYQKEDVEIFLESVQKSKINADIFLFTGKNYQELRSELSSYKNLHILKYQENLIPKVIGKFFMLLPFAGKLYARLIKRIHRLIGGEWTHQFAFPLLHFMSKRFFVLNDFISNHQYSNYLFTDIRDVLFQSDPFKNILFNEIHSGIEPVKSGADELNKKWIEFTLTDDQAESIYDKEIVCAGVILGSAWAFKWYIREFIELTYNSLDTTINKLGADQAIHSYLFHSGLETVKKVLHDNQSGDIVTLHHEDVSQYRWVDDVMSHHNGDQITIIHQYDRHPSLENRFKSKYKTYSENLKLVG